MRERRGIVLLKEGVVLTLRVCKHTPPDGGFPPTHVGRIGKRVRSHFVTPFIVRRPIGIDYRPAI